MASVSLWLNVTLRCILTDATDFVVTDSKLSYGEWSKKMGDVSSEQISVLLVADFPCM